MANWNPWRDLEASLIQVKGEEGQGLDTTVAGRRSMRRLDALRIHM